MYHTEKSVLFSEESYGSFRVAHVELNAPKKLNSVDREMLASIGERLKIWDQDPTIALIVFRSNLEKAFCAGGDVKSLVLEMKSRGVEATARQFFTTEYFVDNMIHELQTATVCLADGITMGGGIGLMNGCTIRVVTERTILAMPEVSIGLFPDVGASYFLPRLTNRMGYFLGLTGQRITGEDGVHFGLADVQVEGRNTRKILADLVRLPWVKEKYVNKEMLKIYFQKTPLRVEGKISTFAKQYLNCESQFAKALESKNPLSAIEEVLSSAAEFQEALSLFKGGSPTTKLITLELLRRGEGLTRRECFNQEWSLAINVSMNGDFIEGVRAQLIDKDKSPKWRPMPTVEQIQKLFDPPNPHDLAMKLDAKPG